jgi:hypothetical protein
LDQEIARDMLIRSFRILQVGTEPQGLMTHAILQDLIHGASLLIRELTLSNHRHILLVGPQAQNFLPILKSLAMDTTLVAQDSSLPVPQEITAVIALDQDSALQIRQALQASNRSVAFRGLGILTGLPICPGYYISLDEVAILAVKLLSDPNAYRPRVLWLSGARVDCLAPSNTVLNVPVSLSA